MAQAGGLIAVFKKGFHATESRAEKHGAISEIYGIGGARCHPVLREPAIQSRKETASNRQLVVTSAPYRADAHSEK